MRRPYLLLPCCILALAACSTKPAAVTPSAQANDPTAAPVLTISDAVVQLPAVPGRPAVAYFVATPGDQAKGTLVAVQVDHFGRAAMHDSVMIGGTMTMNPIDALPIDPAKPLIFAPAGRHVMLFDGDGTLKPGGTTTITLKLDNGSKYTAQAKVTAPGGDDTMGGMKM
jgi:copper(I)-binding protein